MPIYFGQTIDEKLSQADDYYAEDMHIRALDWVQLSDSEKKAALNQAEREVNLYCGIDLEDNYSETDWPCDWNPNFRPDYAIFEHALFLMDNTARTRTSTDGAQFVESSEYQQEEKTTGVVLAPQAQRFLKINRIRFGRG